MTTTMKRAAAEKVRVEKTVKRNPKTLRLATTSYISFHYSGKFCLLLCHQPVSQKACGLLEILVPRRGLIRILSVFADIWGGWACFVVSIIIIGILTAVIGDLASHFGCTVGLKDSVTAISFVALGTSLPGK